MNEETYDSLKDVVKYLKYSNETNDFSYFILNSNNVRNDLRNLSTWIDEVAKEYEAVK